MPSSSTRRRRRHRRRIKQLCLHPNRIQATSVYRHRQTSWNGQNSRRGNNNNNLNDFWDGIDEYITTTDSKTTKNLSTRCPASTTAALSSSSLSQRRIKQLSSGTAKTDPVNMVMAHEEYERVIRQTEEHPFDEISVVVGEIAGNSSSSSDEDDDVKFKAEEDDIPKKKRVNFVHRMFQKMVKVGN